MTTSKKELHMTDTNIALSPLETIDAALASNAAQRGRLEAKRRAIVFRDAVTIGTEVTYLYGRKPNQVTKSGKVLEINDVPTGPHGGEARKVTILGGSGITTKVETVYLNAILSVGGEDVSAAEEVVAEDENPLGEE